MVICPFAMDIVVIKYILPFVTFVAGEFQFIT